ncbi:uncharacterized protein LOC129764500 isoform X2 [Toxorhynchites rutilus septentrionalis]|uniref:uncharacterized protein LOC129764500 isoform X2 n=1 Tax=Toxorhynchites rutilus septentrionalis TaxID=329112 RepID=UPI00247A96A2|nr:uncharacterized protein LOC129764500 isoform X2 [Toxorhynchites rutilus septentrionalis]
MALPQLLVFTCFLLQLILASGTQDLREQYDDISILQRRCPCVPINTCRTQVISLSEQNYLNNFFRCPDETLSHCCGSYFSTLGDDDFYFDGRNGEKVFVVMAQPVTTEKLTASAVITVLPEAVPTTTVIADTTLETTTSDATEPSTTEFTTTTEMFTATEVITTGASAEETETTTAAHVTTMTAPTKRRFRKLLTQQ